MNTLNVEDRKVSQSPSDVACDKQAVAIDVKIVAVMSIPRLGFNDTWGAVLDALRPFKIPVRRTTGVFWGQCMQRAFEGCVADGIDWILTIDYDSMFTARHLDSMFGIFGNDPTIDALAAMQVRRGQPFPLMTIKGETGVSLDGRSTKVTTAHFGLTLIRVDAVAKLPKPWFFARPGEGGTWGDDRLDDDIWFWHQMRLAERNVHVAHDVRIGHLELMVAEFDESYNVGHIYVPDWRDKCKS